MTDADPPSPRVLQQVAARVARPDYDAWAARLAHTGWCAHPVRLKGHIDHVDTATGETNRAFTTATEPDRILLRACSARRATRCPACAAVYRSDARALVLAGLIGGKGIPPDVRDRPVVFVTLTAPSFGAVDTAHPDGAPGHPRPACRHQVRCGRTHKPDDPDLGTPLCPACYDWAGTVIFNARSTELWRRTIIATRRALATQQHIPVRHLDRLVTVAFVKIVEYQTRGVVHFHALLRLDPTADSLGPAGIDGDELAAALRTAAARTACPNPYRPDRPIRWGTQTDISTIPADNRARLAGYLAEYTTKSVTADGTLDRRLTHGLTDTPGPEHLHRLAQTAWTLADHPGLAGLNLRYWAHTLGYPGHWLTKRPALVNHPHPTPSRPAHLATPTTRQPGRPARRRRPVRRLRIRRHRPHHPRRHLARHQDRREQTTGTTDRLGGTMTEQEGTLHPPGESRSRLFTTPQAALHLGVSDRTVKNLMREGKLPYVKIGRATRFDPNDLETFIARNRRKGRRSR